MTMRPFTDTRAGLNHIVDAQIGRAFPVVHKVYEHLDVIEYIAQVFKSGRSRDIVLRTNHTKEWIEWQYKGEDTWTILFKFSDLLGAGIADVVAVEQAIAAELVALRVHIDQARSDTLDASNRAQAAELGAVDAKNAAEAAQASAHASAQSAADHQTATEVAAAIGAQHLAGIEAQVVVAEALKQETVAAHQAGLAAKASAEEAAVNAATFAENADVSAAESATSANEAEASANTAELSAQNAAAHEVEAKNQAVAAEASALASAASATVSSEKLGELIPLHAAAVSASTTATEAAETVTTHLVQITALHGATESFAQAAQASAVQADSAATAAGVSASDALQLRNETQGFHDAASTMVADAAQVSADRATVQTLAQEVQLVADQAQSNALAAADSANAAKDSASLAQTSASEILGQVTTLSGRLDEADSIVTTVTTLRDETLSYKLAVEDSTTNAQAVAADRAAVAGMVGTIAADAASAADSKNQALAAAVSAETAEASARVWATKMDGPVLNDGSDKFSAQYWATQAEQSAVVAADANTGVLGALSRHTAEYDPHTQYLTKAESIGALATKLDVNDPSVTNAREWAATEVSQTEAEAGAATTARKWTAQRVRQAITGWWSDIGTAFGKSLLSLTDAAEGRTALGLENVNNTSDANKSVASAAKLTTARTINGVSFDGTADITVADTTKEPAFVAGTAAQYFCGDKTWRDLATDVRAAPLTGLSTATNAAITASDTVLSASGKLQAQITELDFEKLSQSGGTMTGALTLPDNGLVVGTTQIVASGGNVGFGTSVPKAPIHAFNTSNFGNPDTTGTGMTGVSARIQSGSTNMDFGAYSSGNTWIQSRLHTDNSFTFQLVLNPVGGSVLVGPGGLGYATGIGAGGTVVQPMSKGTTVTLNKPTGYITLANTGMGANTTSGFTLKASVIGSDDLVIASVHSGAADPANYQVWTSGAAAGSCSVYIRNISAATLSESVVLKFAIIKGAAS